MQGVGGGVGVAGWEGIETECGGPAGVGGRTAHTDGGNMINFSPATRIFVALAPVDMRQGFNGLCNRVQGVLGQDPFQGHLYVFSNRRRDRVRILYFDGSGLWVCAKRLEANVFSWPKPEPLAICAHCGKAPEKIGQECTEQLDYIPARLVVRRIVRPKYACRCGEAGVQVAPLPAQLLPQSKLGLGLAVHILLSRFDDHISYYAIERVFRERHGMVIPRQQMVQWMAHVATLLQPLWLVLLAHLKQEAYLQIDETPVKVLDPEVQGRAATGWLRFYAVPGGDVLLDFQDTRGQRAPLERLQGFHGTIQTDAYEVYESLLKVIGTLKRIGCLAHSRRKFYQAMRQGDVQAVWFILRPRDLYRIERLTREMTPEERHRLRQEHAPAIWESIRLKAQELKPKLLPKSTLGKAVSYFLSEYDALCGYLADGRFEIDNNLVENAIRNPVIGRKRWLFIGHPEAGWRSAVLYSFILSCRRRGLNPQDYLTDILRRLPTTPQSDLHQLLPAHWKPLAPA